MVMLIVSFIAFIMFTFIGDPVDQMVGLETTLEEREALREQLGLKDPLPIQFVNFVVNAAQGNFGISYQFKRPVATMIGERLPATLELSFVSALFALLAGIPMGVYTALRRDSILSKLFLTVSLIGISLPTFLIGILLIFFFAVYLQWLPSFGRGEVTELGWWSTGLLSVSGLKAIILPSITLGLFQMTLIMRLVRSEMMEVLRTDYIKFARARGLGNRAIHFGHALKNTMIPVITITGLQVGSIIAFAIITETVFQWPGMGLLFLQGVQNVDIPIMAAYLLLIAFLFVVINLIVDLLYVFVDPRIRLSGGEV
jgi:peptide/nickel transport system permease protein